MFKKVILSCTFLGLVCGYTAQSSAVVLDFSQKDYLQMLEYMKPFIKKLIALGGITAGSALVGSGLLSCAIGTHFMIKQLKQDNSKKQNRGFIKRYINAFASLPFFGIGLGLATAGIFCALCPEQTVSFAQHARSSLLNFFKK